jgi:formylglycine-generating enzyme required for sulfatase activity
MGGSAPVSGKPRRQANPKKGVGPFLPTKAWPADVNTARDPSARQPFPKQFFKKCLGGGPGATEKKRVHRGGSFLCTDQYCTHYMVGTRGKGEMRTASNHVGFPCVKPRGTTGANHLP